MIVSFVTPLARALSTGSPTEIGLRPEPRCFLIVLSTGFEMILGATNLTGVKTALDIWTQLGSRA